MLNFFLSELMRSHYPRGVRPLRTHGGAGVRGVAVGRAQDLGPGGGQARQDAHGAQGRAHVRGLPSIR